MGLAGTKTEANLKAAFAGESQANRRYLYFAQKADIDSLGNVAVKAFVFSAGPDSIDVCVIAIAVGTGIVVIAGVCI